MRSQIDRKIFKQVRPQDLFYQILHGLRSLTRYDHSSALLICDGRENTLQLVAEQIAWLKGKSRRIGLKLPLNEDVWTLMRNNIVYGFDRRNGWDEWSGGKSPALAELLDYNKAAENSVSNRREFCHSDPDFSKIRYAGSENAGGGKEARCRESSSWGFARRE